MLGNVVTGCSVVGPAGMLKELSDGLGVSISTAGLLITFGAVMLCVGSPVTAWLTSRIERRTLLAATLAVLALANIASAFAPDYGSLLAIRLVMLAVGALYTPQAAGTGALIVPEQKRGSTIAYIFLGWSLAAAVGLPLITFIASRYGWRTAYGGIGVLGLVSFLLLVVAAAGRAIRGAGRSQDLDQCRPQPHDPAAAADHDAADVRPVRHLHLHGAAADKADRRRPRCDRAGVFALWRVRFHRRCHRHPDRRFLGALPHIGAVHGLLLTGITGWALSAGIYPLMACSVVIWGLGFASTNSMQQVRLVGAAPSLASASVSLNTSVLYIGQAIGSAIGGALYAHDLLHEAGFVAMAFVAAAFATRFPDPAAAGRCGIAAGYGERATTNFCAGS